MDDILKCNNCGRMDTLETSDAVFDKDPVRWCGFCFRAYILGAQKCYANLILLIQNILKETSQMVEEDKPKEQENGNQINARA